MTDQPDLRDGTGGEPARRRLLAAAPVTERRLELAGLSTPVRSGGSGPVISSEVLAGITAPTTLVRGWHDTPAEEPV